jgi:hypothetical protein
MFFMYYILGVLHLNELWSLASFEDFDSEDSSNLSKEERDCVLHNSSITNLMYNNASKVIQEFIFNNEDICDDAHHIWVALKDMYTSADDDDDEDEEEESLEECSTSTSCITPLKISSTKQKSDNIAATASDQANSVAPIQNSVALGLVVISSNLLHQTSQQHHTSLLRYLQLLVLPHYVLTIPSLK